MTKIAFVGLGNMGGPMAANLVKAGHEVIGFDLSEASMKTAVATGVKGAAALGEAVRDAECVITTEKDAVRLTSLALPHDIAWTYVPMRAAIEPAREFKDWFMARLAEAQAR